MSEILSSISPEDARQLWASLAEEGKSPAELAFAGQVLPTYSVGIGPWIERIAKTYLQELSRRHGHFKLVIAPYGGGKTHFLMSLGGKGLEEGFGVAYVACTQGVNLDSPLNVYRAFMKALQFPGEDRPGVSRFLQRVTAFKLRQIQSAGAPDPEIAFAAWLVQVAADDHPESAFGRVVAEALRAHHDPAQATAGDGALRWLRGEMDTLTKEELTALRLAKVPAKSQAELGRNLLLSVIRFAKEHAGLQGVVLLFDEVETLFTARGKALERVLSAMRVMVDLPGNVPGGVPLLGVFSAVPDVLEQLQKYPALEQRLSVKGVSFDEGNDFALQIQLEKVANEADLLRELGKRLIGLGKLATRHEYDRSIQGKNVERLAHVAAQRSLQIDARRLFVKTCVSILDAQAREGERLLSDDELASRYAGSFESLKQQEQSEPEP